MATVASRALTTALPACPTTSIVLCAYTEDRWFPLAEAIDGALGQVPAPTEVILVVDHNEPLFNRAKVNFSRVKVLANTRARGLSGARNMGIEHARGDIVVFLDDDACPRAEWLAEMVHAFDDPSVIGVGGVAVPRWESGRPRWLPDEFLWVVGCSYRGLPKSQASIRNPIGATMAFRREILEATGGFTDGIGRIGRTPWGCEETELSIRAAALGRGQIIQLPTAIVDHRVPSDRATWAYFRRRCWAEGISKAAVADRAGTTSALRSERTYTWKTLPSGAITGLRAGLHGDPAGLLRTVAIVAGLVVTTVGYFRGRVAQALLPLCRVP